MKKLNLTRETLKALTQDEHAAVQGAANTQKCPTILCSVAVQCPSRDCTLN
ncbi:MAG: hypothetical protein U0P81_13075 [Holophagaceae bacterium]